jgi:ribA/ribD-fused uncharacterized protein
MVLPLTRSELWVAVGAGGCFEFRYFWGHRARSDGALSDAVFSQWWPCRFTIKGQHYQTAEQFMMAAKAGLFDDEPTRLRILSEPDPARCKALGRQVRGFDEAIWVRHRFDLVTRGNLAKFDQDPTLRAWLLATGDAILVEASPRDCIWGIGLGRQNPRARDPRSWRGHNLLGFALVRTRHVLRRELPAP